MATFHAKLVTDTWNAPVVALLIRSHLGRHHNAVPNVGERVSDQEGVATNYLYLYVG